jgi:hypothetical protein
LFAAKFNFNQVPEGQGFVLISILDQNIEIGINHGSLVLTCGLKNDRLNAIFLTRFAL